MALDKDQIRRKIGDNGTPAAFDDTELDEIIAEAVLEYPSSESLQLKWVVVECIENLLADAAKRVTYKQNASSENASDIFKALEKLANRYQAKLASAEAAGIGSILLGTPRKTKPTRAKDTPRNLY